MISIGVTGHQSIPSEALTFIQEGLRDIIRRFGNQHTGVSSLAAGADQLFADLLLRSGGRLHAVIPCHGYESTFSNPNELGHFLALRKSATVVETLNYPEPSEEAFLEAGHRVVDLSDLLVAVWDGKVARGKGGTADIVGYAREHDREVVILWPAGIAR